MVSMEINKATIWYSNLVKGQKVPVLDANGLMTGEYRQMYTEPVPLRVALSENIGLNNLTAQGTADLRAYGVTTNYTHRLITEDRDCPMDEESIIWHYTDPGGDPYSVPYEFKVIRSSRTLNYKMYYLREVNIGEGEIG